MPTSPLFSTRTTSGSSRRTGIRERRVSARIAGRDELRRRRARPRLRRRVDGSKIELIVFGTTSYDDQVPNMASGIQKRIGADGCAAMDVNTACTSFLYSLSTATAMIKTGVVKNALVIGSELISPFMDWSDRNVAVLFGDGAAAVVLQATEQRGRIVSRASRVLWRVSRDPARARHGRRVRTSESISARPNGSSRVRRFSRKPFMAGLPPVPRDWGKLGKGPDDVDLVKQHQANMRIIGSVARKAGVPMERVFVNVHRYGNMSAATVPVALCEALEEGRVKPGALLLMPSFGGGLTFTGHVVRWGQRVTPIATTDIDLPTNSQSALEIVERYRRIVNSPARAT